MSGNAGKNYSSSTLTLTFYGRYPPVLQYKVSSSEAKYDKCTITLGSNTLVNGVSGDPGVEGSGSGRQAGRKADRAV